MADIPHGEWAAASCNYYSAWVDNYNATEHCGGDCHTGGSGAQNVFFARSTGDYKPGIGRAAICFDTSGISGDQEIYSAKLKGKYQFYASDQPDYDINTHIDFMKLSSLVCPGGTEEEVFAQIRGCTDVIAQLSVVKSVTTPTAFERVLGTSGIAHINKEGRTDIALRDEHDISVPPTDHTRAWVIFTELVLEVTYGEGLVVVTLPATLVTNVSMQMNGEITAGSASKRGFDWGESIASLPYECVEEGSFGVEEFSCKIFGLNPGTQYCFRAKALP